MSTSRLLPTLADAIPSAVVTILFSAIAIINWDYAKKLFVSDEVTGNDHVGPILFVCGLSFSLLSSIFFYLLRRSDGHWLRLALNGFVCIACLLIALAFLALGPAAITMREQMGNAPIPPSDPGR